MRGDRLDGRDDERQVGVLRFSQRRRDADVDAVEFRDDSRIARGRQPAGRDELGDLVTGDVGNVGLDARKRRNLPRVEIDADGPESSARELDGQGESDVAESDDSDSGRALCQLVFEGVSEAAICHEM